MKILWARKYLVFLLFVSAFLIQVQIVQAEVCGGKIETALIAGKYIDAGDVVIWNDQSNIYVKYEAKNNYYLEETHLAVVHSLEEIAQTTTGNPQAGLFPYGNKNIPSVSDQIYTINLSEKGFASGDTLYIAAHSIVQLKNNLGEIIQKETAWASGYKFPGKSWATYLTYTIQSCGIQTKEINIDVGMIEEMGISLEQLTITSLLSQYTLSAGEHTAILKFGDVDQGQIIFIEDSPENPFIVAYVSVSDIQKGIFNLTTESIANGLIMANPLMMGFSAKDRLLILEKAKNYELYENLKAEINIALSIEPHNLLNEAIFPNVYKYALLSIIDTLKEQNLQQNVFAPNATMAEMQSIIGDEDRPHLSDLAGDDILTVDPTMIFYGVEIDNQIAQIIAGKDSVWELEFGLWPPIVPHFVAPVTEKAKLGDGNFNIRFSKGDTTTVAGLMANGANALKGLCIILDTFFFCPASNETIENFVEGYVNDPDFLNTWSSFANDILSIKTPKKLIDKWIDLTLDKDVWSYITQAFYASATDKDAAVKFLKNSKKILNSADAVFKVLEVYDAANVTIPFVWDWIVMPMEVSFCVNQSNGILTNTCQYIPPTAVISKISPDKVYVQDLVTFDASGSHDDQDGIDSLLVRWDFNNDGVFDTNWSHNKQASWSYSNVGSYNVILEVKDTDNLIGQTLLSVLVQALDAGGTANHIKVFRDVLPWSTLSFEQVMSTNGYTEGQGENQYEVLPSSAMATEILYPGKDFVIIMNDQNQSFYNNLAASLDRINRFIENGGVVLFGACDLGWAGGSMVTAGITMLPGGTQFQYNFDETNYNINSESVLMSGLPNILSGTFASHEHFLNIPLNSITYMKDTAGYPTLLEYEVGNGWIVITGQPLEYNVVYNSASMGLVYPRLFNYVLGNINQGTAVIGFQTMSPLDLNIPPSHVE